jgi:hypothetical protein
MSKKNAKIATKPARTRKNSTDTVLLLRTTDKDGQSHGGSVWPRKVGAVVTAPDWSAEPQCGGGLHGLLWGLGDQGQLSRNDDALWWVVRARAADVVNLDGNAKVPTCVVRYVGDRAGAVAHLRRYGGDRCGPIGSLPGELSSSTGYEAASSSTGNRAASSSTGNRAASSSTGHWAASSSTGNRAASSSTGNRAASSSTGYGAASSSTGHWAASSSTGHWAASSSTGYWAASSSTGNRAASSSTGNRAASSSTGHWAASSSTGYEAASSSTGYESCAVATGFDGRVRGGANCALVCAERRADWSLIGWAFGVTGRDGIKPHTWYRAEGGKLIECQADDPVVKNYKSVMAEAESLTKAARSARPPVAERS